jgi:hypothetical protein
MTAMVFLSWVVVFSDQAPDESETRTTMEGQYPDVAAAALENRPVSRVIHPAASVPEMKKPAVNAIQNPVALDIPELPFAARASAGPDMQEMGAKEMRRAIAGGAISYMAFALEGRPVTRTVYASSDPVGENSSFFRNDLSSLSCAGEELSEQAMGIVAAGSSAWFTLKDMEVQYWARACEPQATWVGEPESRLLIHSFEVYRGYYNVTKERYGWEPYYEDWADTWRNVDIGGIYGWPLQIDKIVHQIKYLPQQREFAHIHREPFNAKGEGAINCFYREGYLVYFEYAFPHGLTGPTRYDTGVPDSVRVFPDHAFR